jgi:hypothetical protein
MTLIQGKQPAAQLLGDMAGLVAALSIDKRKQLIAALKEIFNELDEATIGGVALRSTKQCLARA